MAKKITSRRLYYERHQYEFPNRAAAMAAAEADIQRLQRRCPETEFFIYDNGDCLLVSSGEPATNFKKVK